MPKSLRVLLIGLAGFLVLGAGVCWFFPGAFFDSVNCVIRWWADLERYEVQVDDHRWVYLEGGEGEKVLLVHGFGADKYSWAPMLLGLSDSYRLVVPDLPGFGESTWVASASYGAEIQAKRLRGFVETLGLKRFHLAGISMGGYIAGYYASLYPESVKSLALMDAAGVESRVPSEALKLYREKGKNVLLYKTRQGFEEFLSLLFYDPPWMPSSFEDYMVRKQRNRYDAYHKILQDIMKGGAALLEDRLGRIEAETLIIWGSNDQIIHVSSVDKFESGIQSTQTVVLDKCGHIPYMERPEKTIQVYRSFLAGLPGSG